MNALKAAMRCGGLRSFSTPAAATVGGVATAKLRDIVAPKAAAKPEYKLPAYLQTKNLRPERGCFSDQQIWDLYIKKGDPNDPYNARSRVVTYFVKANAWAISISTARVAVLMLLSQYAGINPHCY
eukprot:NODE_1390_length_978_cov_191.758881_g938_i2.p2 GENE.NODE_1390_length_978_cov_191.758881_g938_i2~~NODE_1390_length_978_cov_191.758881_g938_i2.p2  ORF type:complete len:126 (+),score=22.62 NODE_1390_length_978_cov_191.758881_g938_i2:91-468(+)